MTGTSDLSSSPVIVLDNLVKFFGRFAAIRGISASFAPGRLYVVLGAGLTGGCSPATVVVPGATAPGGTAPGTGLALLGRAAALAAAAFCSCIGEGGRSIRTDSLVVFFCALSSTCISNLISVPEGE